MHKCRNYKKKPVRVPVGVSPAVVTATPVSTAATAPGRSLGVLNGHPLAADLTVVQLVHCVLSISVYEWSILFTSVLK